MNKGILSAGGEDGTGRRTLKTIALTCVFLATVLIVVAQEADDNNNSFSGRPAETELLLDEADDPEAEGPVGGDSAPGENLTGIGFGDFVRMILVLGIVIVLVYGFFWLLKRFSGVKAEGEDAIRLISTRPLKGDAALHLVETGSRIFLVGSTGNAVNLVAEIDDKESMDQMRLAASRSPRTLTGGFARLFRDRFGIGPADVPPVSGTAGDDPAAYLRRQKERLKEL